MSLVTVPVTAEAGIGIGIDIGGTSAKIAAVDRGTGRLVSHRHIVPNPPGGHRIAMIQGIVAAVGAIGPGSGTTVGIGFPGILRDGEVHHTTHLAGDWIGADLARTFTAALGATAIAVNDADAAGIAELNAGTFRNRAGLSVLTTLGTGIGTALIHNGILIPNAELGHLHLDGPDFEAQAAFSAVRREGITLREWSGRLNRYYRHLERLFSPELFVVGGAAAQVFSEIAPHLDLRTEIVPTRLGADAGIVGAALAAGEIASGGCRISRLRSPIR